MAELPLLSAEFRNFLVDAKTHGYGAEAVEKMVLGSGAVEIIYQDKDWLYTDNYVGGDPFTGYEHVSVRHPDNAEQWLPVWGMSYFGTIVNPKLSGQTLTKLLGEVLSKPDSNLPVRGPAIHLFQNGWGSYRLRGHAATLESFSVDETIGRSVQHVVYRAHFIGGLINRNPQHERLKPKWLAH